MVQVGTTGFEAERFCNPTIVTLSGTDASGLDEALKNYTDGY